MIINNCINIFSFINKNYQILFRYLETEEKLVFKQHQKFKTGSNKFWVEKNATQYFSRQKQLQSSYSLSLINIFL